MVERSLYVVASLLICLCLKSGFGGHVSLTTAVLRDGISAKPTTIHRRINVDSNFMDKAQIHFALNDKLRRSRSNVWNWDYWCLLQPKTGNCSKNIVRYYYDAQLDQCRMFFHTGCNGNKNLFETLVDCERYCKGASYMPIKYTDKTSYCSLQADSGLCMAMVYKYYYNVNEGRCKTFIYGGCGGNQNRFSSLSDCNYRCGQNGDDYTF